MKIDLADYYGCGDAAAVLTRNSGHIISGAYVRGLAVRGILKPIKVSGRCLYPRRVVDGLKIGRRSRKCGDIVA